MRKLSHNNQLLIAYFVAVLLIAVSINSIAKGIENHEAWRIVAASIGGSFFVFVAAISGLRLIKQAVAKRKRRRAISFRRKWHSRLLLLKAKTVDNKQIRPNQKSADTENGNKP